MQRIDQHKRVLIHRVAVIRIANHQRIDPVKLRNQQLQHAQRMHRPQRHSRIPPVRISCSSRHSAGPSSRCADSNGQRLRDPLLRLPCPARTRSAPSPQTPAARPPDPAPDPARRLTASSINPPRSTTRNPAAASAPVPPLAPQPQQPRRSSPCGAPPSSASRRRSTLRACRK